jgi:hypothetical protein
VCKLWSCSLTVQIPTAIKHQVNVTCSKEEKMVSPNVTWPQLGNLTSNNYMRQSRQRGFSQYHSHTQAVLPYSKCVTILTRIYSR